MSNIDKQALIAKIKKQTESFDTVVLKEDEANALLDELAFLDKRNAELNSTLERWAVDRAQSASELDDAEKRIAELEESHAQVIISRDHYKRMCGEQMRRVSKGINLSINGEG